MSINTVDVKESDGGGGWERTVRRAVGRLRYGSIELQVHDGRVVQVETREKVRFEARGRTQDRTRPQGPEGRARV